MDNKLNLTSMADLAEKDEKEKEKGKQMTKEEIEQTRQRRNVDMSDGIALVQDCIQEILERDTFDFEQNDIEARERDDNLFAVIKDKLVNAERLFTNTSKYDYRLSGAMMS